MHPLDYPIRPVYHVRQHQLSAQQCLLAQGLLPHLHEMYDEWPFFQSLIDLIEMILTTARFF
jgi:phosphoenolpyruvate carboxylase